LIDEAEANDFHAGLPQFYSHIMELFERQKRYSHVMDFAGLALQSLHPLTSDATLRAETLSRLFYASIQTSRFSEAYSALMQYSNKTL
jgi:hypothetical protein